MSTLDIKAKQRLARVCCSARLRLHFARHRFKHLQGFLRGAN